MLFNQHFLILLIIFSGSHKDHRQKQAGQNQSGESLSGGRSSQASRASQHHQALSSHGDQEHALSGVRIRFKGRNFW